MNIDHYATFMKLLSENEDTPAIAQEALASVASQFLVGKVTGKVEVEPGPLSPMGEYTEFAFYTDGQPADENRNLTLTRPTVDGGFASVICYHVSGGDDWTEEDSYALRVIGDALLLHLSRHRLNLRFHKSAYTQYLTGLPNSGGYLQRVGEIFAKGQIGGYDAFYYNLKGMNYLNLKYGQGQGDEILRRHSRYLNRWKQEDECLGHLGGDNFVALIRKENTEEFLDLLLGGIDIEISVRNMPTLVTITATVGVMRIDQTIPGPWAVISAPTSAAQIAKETGQNLVELTREMMEYNNRATLVENTFMAALAQGQFQPYYQPKVNMKTGEIVGAEVLARWIRDGRVVPPAEFVPVLEKSGGIVELDMYMLEQACMDMKEWTEAGEEPVPLSVNISRRDLETPDLAERISDCINRYNVDRKYLLIEVTETANEKENQAMMEFLNRMSDGNIATSIDDFGTGFSSLSFLRDFPTSEIKIDRSFINHEKLREKDRVIISNIISMARQLGIDVITEGVENKDQVDFLLGVGCERAQGFLYDRPLPREEFKDRLLRHSYRIDG